MDNPKMFSYCLTLLQEQVFHHCNSKRTPFRNSY